jgi:hypothetical protein
MEKMYQAAYATICNENHLFDKHASASWVTRLFFNVNECVFGGNVKLNNQLKALVTEKTMMVEEKFCATKSVDSHSNFITTSNETRGLKLQHGDRRFAIITTSSEYTGPSNKDFWANVAEAVEHPDFGQELLRFPINHAEEADIRAWNERVLPSDMPGKVALQLRYRPKNFAFLQELCMDGKNVYGLKLKREVCPMRILPQDLHVAYLIFADKARLKESCASRHQRQAGACTPGGASCPSQHGQSSTSAHVCATASCGSPVPPTPASDARLPARRTSPRNSGVKCTWLVWK